MFMFTACSVMLPVAATGEVPSPSDKVGTAKVVVPFGLVFGGDASIEKAAASGGITNIKTVNLTEKNIFGIVRIYETKVTGE